MSNLSKSLPLFVCFHSHLNLRHETPLGVAVLVVDSVLLVDEVVGSLAPGGGLLSASGEFSPPLLPSVRAEVGLSILGKRTPGTSNSSFVLAIRILSTMVSG